MYRPFLIAGALLGGLGVALGAFGAHGLQQLTSDEKIIHSYQTAVQYQIYHALALLAIAIIYEKRPDRIIKWAGNLILIGIILFSGSLYLITLFKVNNSGPTQVVGPITPLGGVFFILGWVMLLVGVMRKRN